MTETDYRALIEFHARAISDVTREPKDGYGVMKKDRILEHVKRLQELASNLEG